MIANATMNIIPRKKFEKKQRGYEKRFCLWLCVVKQNHLYITKPPFTSRDYRIF
jgi:hypothetical protein